MWTFLSIVLLVTIGAFVDLRPSTDPCYDAQKKLHDCLIMLPKDSDNFLPDDNFISTVCSRNLLGSVNECVERDIGWNCAEIFYWTSMKNKYGYICKSQDEYLQHTHCRNNISLLRELGGCIEVQKTHLKEKVETYEICIVYSETKRCLEKSTERFCSQHTAEFLKLMYHDTVSPFMDFYRCAAISPDPFYHENYPEQVRPAEDNFLYNGIDEFPIGENLFQSTLSKEHAVSVALENNNSIPTESSNTTSESTTSLSSTTDQGTGTILPVDIFASLMKGVQMSNFSTIEHKTIEETASSTTGSYDTSMKSMSKANISDALMASTDISFVQNSSVESVIVSSTTTDSTTWSWFEIVKSGGATIFMTTSCVHQLDWYLVLYVFLPLIIVKLVPMLH